MTDIADFTATPAVSRQKTASVPLPAPVLFDAPVLISDCNSQLADETLLSLIWRRLDGANGKRPDQ